MLPTLLITFVFIGIGWFLLIRPQQERAKAQTAMVAALEVGDQVISAGGIHGTLVEVFDETVTLEVAPGSRLTLARPAIARRIEPDLDAEADPIIEPDPAEPSDQTNPGSPS